MYSYKILFVWPLGTGIVELFVVSVRVGPGALIRMQISGVVVLVFNTNSYLTPNLDMNRTMPLPPLPYRTRSGVLQADFCPYLYMGIQGTEASHVRYK